MRELVVVINGEIIRLPHKWHQKVGNAIAAAFKLSTQQVGTGHRWRIESVDGDSLSPGDKVGYLEQIWVSLTAGPLDGGVLLETPRESLSPIV